MKRLLFVLVLLSFLSCSSEPTLRAESGEEDPVAKVLMSFLEDNLKKAKMSAKIFACEEAIWEKSEFGPTFVYLPESLYKEVKEVEKTLKFDSVAPYGYCLLPMSEYKPKKASKDFIESIVDILAREGFTDEAAMLCFFQVAKMKKLDRDLLERVKKYSDLIAKEDDI